MGVGCWMLTSAPRHTPLKNPSRCTIVRPMKTAFPLLAVTCLLVGLLPLPAPAGQVNVTQYHNHLSRDGIYIDPAFTHTAAAGLARDTSFNGSISGNVYAQPLYIEGGPGRVAMVIAVTESNNVYALNATSGGVLWQVNLGAPIPLSLQPCGNINPEGIAGTPVVDLPSRSLLLDTDVTPDGLTTHHLIYSLSVDTGSTNAGWPVDVNSSATFGSAVFSQVTLRLDPRFYTGRTFTVTTRNNSEHNIYIQAATLNDRPLQRAWLPNARFCPVENSNF